MPILHNIDGYALPALLRAEPDTDMTTLPEDSDTVISPSASADRSQVAEPDWEYLADPVRLATLARSGLMDSPTEAAFDRLTQLAHRVLDAPVILISLVDEKRQFLKSGYGLTEPLATTRQTGLSHSFCKHVVATRQTFEVNDTANDPRVADNGATREGSVASYLGVPLTGLDGQIIGSFCAVDRKPRQWSDEERAALHDFASLTMTESELRAALQEAHDAQAALAQSNHLLREVTESAPSIIYLYDLPTLKIVYINRAIETLLGYTADEIAALKGDPALHYFHRDDLPLLHKHRAQLGACGDGEYRELEYRLRDKEGCWCWLRSRETVFERSEDGVPRLILGVAEDFTDRRKAEADLQDAAAELRRSNQALQEFASVASHDLQEPLRKILAFGDRLRTKASGTLDASSQDYLGRMLGAADRMQTLISDLLDFSRVTSNAQPITPVALGPIIEGVLSDLETQIGRTGGKVEVGALPTLPADPLQMRQLFQNLIGNALKFARPGIPPLVRVCADLEEETASCVQITVEDNGIGFEPRYADRIFEVFERLNQRSQYEGNGIGLAICRRIVERHGGTIIAESEPRTGTKFVVTLPYNLCAISERPKQS